MCDYCVNGWVNTYKFFVTTDNIDKINLSAEPTPGKSMPKAYDFGERCICELAAHNGNTDFVFQSSLIGNNYHLIGSDPLIFVDDRIYLRDSINKSTKRVKNITLSKELMKQLMTPPRIDNSKETSEVISALRKTVDRNMR